MPGHPDDHDPDQNDGRDDLACDVDGQFMNAVEPHARGQREQDDGGRADGAEDAKLRGGRVEGDDARERHHQRGHLSAERTRQHRQPQAAVAVVAPQVAL